MSDSEGGGCGCVSVVITVLVLWALVFGVTWDGRHYEVGFSCDRGVVVE